METTQNKALILDLIDGAAEIVEITNIYANRFDHNTGPLDKEQHLLNVHTCREIIRKLINHLPDSVIVDPEGNSILDARSDRAKGAIPNVGF